MNKSWAEIRICHPSPDEPTIEQSIFQKLLTFENDPVSPPKNVASPFACLCGRILAPNPRDSRGRSRVTWARTVITYSVGVLHLSLVHNNDQSRGGASNLESHMSGIHLITHVGHPP